MTKKKTPPKAKTPTQAREASQTAIVEATDTNIEVSEKFKDWVALFMDKSKPETYGNATRCAMAVYGLTNYFSAGDRGSKNLKRLKNIAAMISDHEGFGMADLMKIGLNKMAQGSYGDWKDFMQTLGYIDPPAKGKEPGNTFNFENLNIAIMNDRKARGLE